MPKKCFTLIFSLLILCATSLLFSACGSSVDMSRVKTAEDTESKLGVKQYKPEPEPKPQQTPRQETRTPTETKTAPTTSTPEPPKTQPAPSVNRSQSDTYLPDFLAFANNKAELFENSHRDNSKMMKYNIASSPEKYSTDDVIQEYVNLITSKYNFEQVHFSRDAATTHYCFIYTGSGNVKQFNEPIKKNVNLDLVFYRTGQVNQFNVRYADGINYTDTGDRTRFQIQEIKHNPQPSGSGGGSSFDYPSGPEMRNAADEIRDVYCSRCDGRGYIEEFEYYNGPHYGETPPPGITVRKTCPDCNGMGRRKLNW